MLTVLVSALVLSPAFQQRPDPVKLPSNQLPKGLKPIRMVVWLPPFVPLIQEPARTEWRNKLLAALNKPKVSGAYVGFAADKLPAEMAKRGMDPKNQKATWKNEDLLAIGQALKARYVAMVDIHPIEPNVGANKELVGVTAFTYMIDVSTKKSVIAEKTYGTGPLPTPGKGKYQDGLATAIGIAEKKIPEMVKQRLEGK